MSKTASGTNKNKEDKARLVRHKVAARKVEAHKARTHFRIYELANQSGVSESLLRDLIHEGQLEAIRAKRMLLVSKVSWDRWLKRHTLPAKAEAK